MTFSLDITDQAQQTLADLEELDPNKYKKVIKTLGLMQRDLRHQSLKTHKYKKFPGFEKRQVFESYVENNTPGAFRIFWCYAAAERGVLTILAITPHP